MQNFKKFSMNEDIARQIISWVYDDDYAIYNLPSYEEMKEKNYGMVNPEKADSYICYLSNDEVIAYSNIKETKDKRIFIGIGLKPEYCGKGLGSYFLNDTIDEIKNRYPNFSIYLEVRPWNTRAIKLYKKVGFIITDTVIIKDHLGNDTEFIEMKLV